MVGAVGGGPLHYILRGSHLPCKQQSERRAMNMSLLENGTIDRVIVVIFVAQKGRLSTSPNR